MKNVQQKRKNRAELPRGYALRFVVRSATSLGFTMALLCLDVRCPEFCMIWVGFEVQGEAGSARGRGVLRLVGRNSRACAFDGRCVVHWGRVGAVLVVALWLGYRVGIGSHRVVVVVS
jgi:hypothetical protein